MVKIEPTGISTATLCRQFTSQKGACPSNAVQSHAGSAVDSRLEITACQNSADPDDLQREEGCGVSLR